MLRRLLLPVYLPCFFINGGTAMLAPLLPLYLAEVGVTDSVLGLIISAAGVGGMLSQIAWGRLIDRVGEDPVLVLAVAVIVGSVAAFGVIGSAIALGALRLFGGAGTGGWILSRQTYLTYATEPETRGKAMAYFGGTTRIAFLIGPVVAGAVAEVAGFPAAFALSAATTGAGVVPLVLWRNQRDGGPGTAQTDDSSANLGRPEPTTSSRPSLRPHLRNLALAGFGQILVITARTGRFVVLPLIGGAVGLSVRDVGLLVGVGGLADFLLFPVSGLLMDRFGRLAAIAPAFSLMGAGLFLLAAASTGLTVTVAAIVIGVGNGLGSGTMLTLSADLAPAVAPSGFLAALGTIRDAGKIAGPLVVGVVTDIASLSVSASVMGATAIGAVVVIVFGIGETLDRSPVPQHVG